MIEPSKRDVLRQFDALSEKQVKAVWEVLNKPARPSIWRRFISLLKLTIPREDKDNGLEGQPTHTICPTCFEQHVGCLHPPVIDDALVMQAQMLATGANVHALNQAIGGYRYAPEWYMLDLADADYEGMSRARAMHTECERRIKAIILAEKIRRAQA